MATLNGFFQDKVIGDGRKFKHESHTEDGWFQPIFRSVNEFTSDHKDDRVYCWYGLMDNGYGEEFDDNEHGWSEFQPSDEVK